MSFSATYRSLLHAAVFKDNSPFALHVAMFIPAILGQADEEQKKYWMNRASKMEIIGTYAQVRTTTWFPRREQIINLLKGKDCRVYCHFA